MPDITFVGAGSTLCARSILGHCLGAGLLAAPAAWLAPHR